MCRSWIRKGPNRLSESLCLHFVDIPAQVSSEGISFSATRQDDVDGKDFVFYLLLELKHAIYASRQSADEKYAQ